jgi:hypothetical protein
MPNCPIDFAKITYFKSGNYMLRIILYILGKNNGLTAYKKTRRKYKNTLRSVSGLHRRGKIRRW